LWYFIIAVHAYQSIVRCKAVIMHLCDLCNESKNEMMNVRQ
jgi:hypothetical protein